MDEEEEEEASKVFGSGAKFNLRVGKATKKGGRIEALVYSTVVPHTHEREREGQRRNRDPGEVPGYAYYRTFSVGGRG